MGHFITRDGQNLYVHDDGKVYPSNHRLDTVLAESEAEAVAVFFDKKPWPPVSAPVLIVPEALNLDVEEVVFTKEEVAVPTMFKCETCGYEAASNAGLGAHKRRHKYEVT